MAGIAAFTAIPKQSGTNGVMFGLAAAIAGFFLLITWQRWRQCARPDNWLLRETEHGIEINLRSDLGPRGDRPYPTVLSIPREQILGIRRTIEVREMHERRGPEKHTYVCIDLELEGMDADGLRGLLRAERRMAGRPGVVVAGSSRGFPVRVLDEHTLRLVWDRIFPHEKHALAHLAQHYPRRDNLKVVQPKFETSSAEVREELIAAMWEAGFVEQAARMVRLHHNLSERDSLAWLEQRFEEV